MSSALFSNYLIPTLIFLIFCSSHSLLASVKCKELLFRSAVWLKPWYRLLYNLLALLLFGAWYLSLPADQILYRVPQPFFTLLIVLQISVAVIAAYLFLNLSGGGLTGLTQMREYLKRGAIPNYLDEPDRGKLNRKGLYNHVRHPVYTFVMIILIASPAMSLNLIYIIISVGFYFYVGTYFEERNLIRRFGDEYRAYQNEVPRFLPVLFRTGRKK
ncbi:MAG: isoprenylcysteine carboxylmethyltransferase family protein [Balneolaceae bacterium]|nr:MAG: isoprenylcysteine carboxylmethyltransferase family protein [Balneolaceae bacterium]